MKKYNLEMAGCISVLATASLVAGCPALAETTTAPDPSNDTVNQVSQMVSEENNAVAQNVTSVSQLSDVKPTDWAFTALQSLVERYGCIAGYPDRTFRGQRSLSRFEFAAGLNACLDKINEILTAGLADKVSKEDFAAVQKLQEEFAAELAAIKGRVDALENKTAQLEAQQFSTTTKLTGEAIFAVTGGGGGGGRFYSSNVGALPGAAGNGAFSIPSGNVNTTFNSRIRLNFNTSFTGNDLLITRLEAGNGGGTAGSILGNVPAGDVGNLGFDSFGLDYAGLSSNFTLAKLRYDFKLGQDFKVSLGPVMHVYDHVDMNSFANNEAVDFSSTFFINNPLTVLVNPQTGGAGAAIDWNPGNGAFSVRAVYLAANASDANSGLNRSAINSIVTTGGITTNRGLFGDPYQGTVELEFAPKDGEKKGPFAIRLQYTNASISNLTINTGGVNVEWAFAKGAALFGRYGFGSIDSRNGVAANANPALRNFVNANATSTSISPQTWMFGLAFPDLFKPGALAAIAVGQPFIASTVGNSSQTNVELFYNFPITDNIRITPDLQFIFNPNNNSANGTVTVGTLRTVFSF
ncbi:MAG: iron uptake porin [Pseudanabaena sp. RU_4_16]|nr:iron uptake porin [Pseudanabaena sp. RU_4_16]